MCVCVQVKLFREWSAKWPADLKQTLRDKCQQIDAEWSDRFAAHLAAGGELAAATANGYDVGAVANGFGDGDGESAAHVVHNGVRHNDHDNDDDDQHGDDGGDANVDADNDGVGRSAVSSPPSLNLANGGPPSVVSV